MSRIQTRGRGRLGRAWNSEFGGLYLSITLIPKKVDALDQITVMLAKSVIETLEGDFQLQGCAIKFPNDVLCEGKKIAGVLADTSVKGVLSIVYAGIGVNLNNGENWDAEMKNLGTSYLQEKGRAISEDEFLLGLIGRIDVDYYNLLNACSLHGSSKNS